MEFLIFFPPYSIVFWDNLNQYGGVEKQIMAEKTVIELLLECENVELYSFFGNYSLITDLNHYKDTIHYMQEVNEQILNWIYKGEYRITHENYMEYLENNLEFYKNYPYETIFE